MPLSLLCAGEWAEDMRHGWGTYTYINGDTYTVVRTICPLCTQLINTRFFHHHNHMQLACNNAHIEVKKF